MSDGVITVLLIGVAIVCLVVLMFLMRHMREIARTLWHQGAPFVPSADEKVAIMMEFAALTQEDIVIDLGSGDGHVLEHAIQQGSGQVIGYEINPRLVQRSRKRLAPYKKASVLQASMWEADLSQATVIFVYQISYAMDRLAQKLKEAPKGTRIIANGFAIPGFQATREKNRVWLYVK